jgi:hypothetical protein
MWEHEHLNINVLLGVEITEAPKRKFKSTVSIFKGWPTNRKRVAPFAIYSFQYCMEVVSIRVSQEFGAILQERPEGSL